MNYKYYNPRKAALDTARELLTGALNAAVADGSLPEAPLPEFIVEIPADVKTAILHPTPPWPVPVRSTKLRARLHRPLWTT